jgi:periplasmic protein TonB
MKDLLSLLAALVLHGIALFAGGNRLDIPAQLISSPHDFADLSIELVEGSVDVLEEKETSPSIPQIILSAPPSEPAPTPLVTEEPEKPEVDEESAPEMISPTTVPASANESIKSSEIMSSSPIPKAEPVHPVGVDVSQPNASPESAARLSDLTSLASPHYLKNPSPQYPTDARKRGEEGRVILLVAVNEKGLVDSVSILTSSGYPSLDTAALKCVKRWKFVPAKKGDVAVASDVEIPIRFTLSPDEQSN